MAKTGRANTLFEDGGAANIDSAPVWSAVTNLLAHAKSLLPKLGGLLSNAKDTCYSTHNTVGLLMVIV